VGTRTCARMLETATRLVQARGYHGTGLNSILEESQAPRGSLYFHFPGGKSKLVLESTKAAVDAVTQERTQILSRAESPAAALRLIGEGIAKLLRETDFERGCPISPIVFDGTGESPELSGLCESTFEAWIGLLRAGFERAGIPRHRAKSLSILAQSALQGAALIARAYRSDEPIVQAVEELAKVVEAELLSSG